MRRHPDDSTALPAASNAASVPSKAQVKLLAEYQANVSVIVADSPNIATAAIAVVADPSSLRTIKPIKSRLSTCGTNDASVNATPAFVTRCPARLHATHDTAWKIPPPCAH